MRIVGVVAVLLALDWFLGYGWFEDPSAADPPIEWSWPVVAFVLGLVLVPAWIGRTAVTVTGGSTPNEEQRRARQRGVRFFRILAEVGMAPVLLCGAYDIVMTGSIGTSASGWAILSMIFVGFPSMIISVLADG